MTALSARQHRTIIALLCIAAALAVSFALSHIPRELGISAAHAQAADGSGSGSALVFHVGSDAGSAVAVATAPRADQLPDPTHAPLSAITAEKTLWHYGWAFAFFGGLVMALQILVWIRTSLSSVPLLGRLAAWLAVQKRVVWVSTLSVGAVAGYNALLEGGTWFAALILLGGKVLALVNFGTPQPQQSS